MAHGVISSLKEAYGDRFVPISIHFQTPGDGFNYPAGSVISLISDAGDYYASKWNIIDPGPGLPTGTIDMTTLSDYSTWPSMVRNLMKETSPVDIQLEASIENNILTATANLAAAENVSGTLLFWLCESHLRLPQIQPDGTTVFDYEHNHILRDAIGDRDGQKINIPANETDARTVSISLEGTNYVPENLSVVAFIMKDPWRDVIQAAEFDFTAHE